MKCSVVDKYVNGKNLQWIELLKPNQQVALDVESHMQSNCTSRSIAIYKWSKKLVMKWRLECTRIWKKKWNKKILAINMKLEQRLKKDEN